MTRQGMYRIMLADILHALDLLKDPTSGSKAIQAALDECPYPSETNECRGPFNKMMLQAALYGLVCDLQDAIDGSRPLGILDGETGAIVRF